MKYSSLTDQEVERLNSLQVPVPKNERKRLSVIKSSQVLAGFGKVEEEEGNKFDRLTKLAGRFFKVCFSYNIFLESFNLVQ